MTKPKNEEETLAPTDEEFDEREIKDYERYKTLSDIIDSSFGTPSRKNSGYSVKMKIVGDAIMQVAYTSVGNFIGVSPNAVKGKFHKEGLEAIKNALDVVKEDYLDATDKEISFKIDSEKEDIELLQGSYGNPKRTCIYRLTCMVKMK